MTDVQRAKRQQEYDSNPPRCTTCLFFSRQPRQPFAERTVKTRNGKEKKIRINLRPNPLKNPLVDLCTFGNFVTKPHAVCDEWRSRDGERIINALTEASHG